MYPVAYREGSSVGHVVHESRFNVTRALGEYRSRVGHGVVDKEKEKNPNSHVEK